MSARSLKVLLVGLGVLVVAWLLAMGLHAGGPAPGDGDGALAAVVEGLDPPAVTAVTFSGAGSASPDAAATGGPVRLVRDDGSSTGWSVDGHPADSTRVARLLEDLGGATAGPPVSVNPAHHARMGVDEASARLLVVQTAAGTDSLLLGDAVPSTGGVYARLPGRDEVYAVDADLHPAAARGIADWRSRLMAAVDTGAVASVEVRRDGEAYTLERGDSAWTVNGGPAMETAVRGLLDELTSLQATGFPGPGAEPLREGSPDRVVTVRGRDGAERLVVRIWTAAPEEESGVATGARDPVGEVEGPGALQPGTPFVWSTWRIDRVAPEPGEIGTAGGN